MMKNKLAVFAMVSFMTIASGCNDRYQEGFTAGRAEGYEQGYNEGDTAGYERAREYFQSADYAQGYSDGNAAGLTLGRNEGYAEGMAIGLEQGHQTGYDTGYNDGYDDGHADGYNETYDIAYDSGYGNGYSDGSSYTNISNARTDGYNDGYDDGDADGYGDGYDDGYAYAYDDGYDDGFYDGDADGYTDGYNDGYDDGYAGLSVGPTKTNTSNQKVNLLSRVHNDLVNYAKIKAPKRTTRGLEVGGRLVFEETSMGSKDLEKRAAAVEKYLVGEMAKQINAKFGLSAERSFKVAKIANHWRKFSTTRAVTDEDADAFSSELVGANLKQVETAVKKSMKGESQELNQLLKKAAEVNQTSPENISLIMNKLFF